MRTKFYIKDNNGDIFSENRKTRYRLIKGQELKEYIANGMCKNKNFFVFVDDQGDKIVIEGNKKIIDEYISEKRHSRYIRNIKKSLGYVVISNGEPIKRSDCLTILDTLADESVRFEDDLIEADLLERLRLALALLEDDEYDLVYFLYLMDNPFSERELAFLTDTPQTTINYRKAKVIGKLKKYLNQ